MAFSWKSLLTDVASALLKEGARSLQSSGKQQRRGPSQPRREQPAAAGGYPGDFTGIPQISYSPQAGDTPDPGEVVWAWVPYEEDHSQGKDRPVLLVGRDGDWLLALPLTSKDHDRDAAQEARAGRHWIDVGTGAWDRQGRPSEARVDRIIRVAPDGVRRTGAALNREVFDRVADAVVARATR
ncbi:MULTISPECIES: type II toxin-antitoxin system PemK/MazF family toxin [unclassified Luteococcus]|uniref:type II toxin-antitoxin system PemK/MazF family toxin n=1 Tax=unclassified Luteococcus TaxID=2639923 RepID=UPI00313D7FAA